MSKLNPLAAAIGATLVSSSLSLSALAANPFQATELSSGYQLADNHEKPAEGKCGEGKCGEGKCGTSTQPPKVDDKGAVNKSTGEKYGEGKCGEGKCGSQMNVPKDTQGNKKEG